MVEEDQDREYLSKWTLMEYSQVMKELAHVITRPLSIIFKQSWLEVPEDWQKTSTTHNIKKGKKEDLGNCRIIKKNGQDGERVRWTEKPARLT